MQNSKNIVILLLSQKGKDERERVTTCLHTVHLYTYLCELVEMFLFFICYLFV